MDQRPVMFILTVAIAVAMAGCSPGPTQPSPARSNPPAPSSSVDAAASGPVRDLTALIGPLTRGSYTKTGFRPPITFDIGDGWAVGSRTDGFFDIQQDPGSPDVIAVQFARVDGIVGADGSELPATTAEDGIAAIHANPRLTVLDESPSQIGGLEGLNVVVENRGDATAPVMRVQPGTLGFDPGRRLWISLFDTAHGVIAVMVGGSVTQWDRTLRNAEPVLESIEFSASAD